MKIIKKHIFLLLKKYNTNCYIYTLKIQPELHYKSINNKYINNKFGNSFLIINQLNIYLHIQKIIGENIMFLYFVKYRNFYDKLCNLLSNILYIGLEWYLYINFHNKIIYQSLLLVYKKHAIFLLSNSMIINRAIKYISNFFSIMNINLKNIKCKIFKYITNYIHLIDIDLIIKHSANYIIKPSKLSVYYILSLIRNKLYHKNKQNYWRINNYKSSSEIILYIKNTLYYWYFYYLDILSQKEVLKINQVIDQIFYIWQIKK